ncbi:hypothetical protein [Falsiroseomonas oryzae]|uniref:hypothetical protein n=1 Tax=Falsiroseomonas oryzae TaxID=2766473 RepID=UPI0022EB0662|nr:hypothetical protein [Roseomonas sp. MO-31]
MQDPAVSLDRFLSALTATLPSYPSDGRLYFPNDADGSAQVWERLPHGRVRPRTAHRDAVSFVAGSPVDGGAVFGRDAAGDERAHHAAEYGDPARDAELLETLSPCTKPMPLPARSSWRRG